MNDRRQNLYEVNSILMMIPYSNDEDMDRELLSWNIYRDGEYITDGISKEYLENLKYTRKSND